MKDTEMRGTEMRGTGMRYRYEIRTRDTDTRKRGGGRKWPVVVVACILEPKMATRGLQDGPKRLHEGPKTAQDDPKRPQDGPERAPRKPTMASDVWSIVILRFGGLYWSLRWPHDSSKMAQRGPAKGLRRPKMTPRGFKMAPRGPRENPRWLPKSGVS